jgi:hypothetical protein
MALSTTTPFDQWVDSEEAQGLEGIDKIKAYGDHYRTTQFAAGSYNPQQAQLVDRQLFDLARNSGFVEGEEEEAYAQFVAPTPKEPTNQDLAQVVEHQYGVEGKGLTPVRDYLSLRNISGADEDLVAERAEAAAEYLTPEKIDEAKRFAAQRGDIPLHASPVEGGLDIEVSPFLEEDEITNEMLVDIAKSQGIDSRYLPQIKDLISKPAGLNVSKARAVRNMEIRSVVASSDDEAITQVRDRVLSLVKDGDLAYARNVAQDAARSGALSRQYSSNDVVDAVMDYAKVATQKDQPSILSTGEVMMPHALLTRGEDHDALVDSLDISDEQKALTKESRSIRLAQMAPHMHKVATAAAGSEYTEFYEQGKASGKSDAAIIEEWFSDDDNFSGSRQMLEGAGTGFLRGFGGLVLYPLALAGNETARKDLARLQEDESHRQEYASLFGEEFGIGYSIVTTAPEVAADILLSIPTGGAAGVASAGTRWTMKQGAKVVLRDALSTSARATTAAAIKKGAPGSITAALELSGRSFTQKLGTLAQTTLATAPTAYSRSAGATYASTYSALEAKHPEWSAEKIRTAALGHANITGMLTVGIMSAFSGLALASPKYFGAGVEEWATSLGDGLTVRQARAAYQKLALKTNKIPAAAKHYLNMESFEGFVSSIAKEGMRKSFGKNLVRQGSSEALEEGLDEFINGWRTSAFLDEDKSILDHLRSAAHAAIVGGVFGTTAAVKEGGFTSKVSDTAQAQFERDSFVTIADGLERSGDVQSAAVLRGLVARSRRQKNEVTKQLETLGRFAQRQEVKVGAEVSPYENLVSVDPTLPRVLQDELTYAEQYIDSFKGRNLAELSTQERVNLAAAKIYRSKISDVHAKAATEAEAGVEPLTDPDETRTNIAALEEEITRLSASPSQASRVAELTTQKEALEARLAPEPSTPTPVPLPGDRGPGPVNSKIHNQLAQTEELLARLRVQEKANPALRNSPAHRAKKFELRDQRRRQREALANGDPVGKELKWRQFPLERIAEILQQGTRGEVYDPSTNRMVSPTEDPALAVDIIQRAAAEKEKFDNASRAKQRRGTPLTEAEKISLATQDPLEAYEKILTKFGGPVATPPGNKGPGPGNSKIHNQLAQTEELLARLGAQEKANPSLRNSPSHRIKKFELRDQRRRQREALANGGPVSKDIKWRHHPLERIAELIRTNSVDEVFDPASNQTFIPAKDPARAVDIIQRAAAEKEKFDNASRAKQRRGTPLTEAEKISLATQDPLEAYQDILTKFGGPVATPPGNKGPGPGNSKIHNQLAQTEELLARLGAQEKANPSLRNSPAHRIQKFELRDQRRRQREALANGGPVRNEIKWRHHPLERIAELIRTDSVDEVFDPASNQTFIPTIDPELAVETIKRASAEKAKFDNASRAKQRRGTTLTEAEKVSLVTQDPLEAYQDILEKVEDVIEELAFDPSDESDSPNPDVASRARALRVAKAAAQRAEAEAEIDAIPEDAPGVAEAVQKFAEAASEVPEAQPRSSQITAEGSDTIVVVTESEATVYEGDEEVSTEPVSSFEEAVAIANEVFIKEGVEPEDISQTEPIEEAQPVDPNEGIEEALSEAADAETEEAAAEYIAAELEAIQTGKSTTEVLEEKEEEVRKEFKVIADVAPLLSSHPGAGWTAVWVNKPVAIKGYDPAKHVAKSENGEVVVRLRKGNKRKLKKEVVPLFGPETTLYDDNGSPQFLTTEDETLFYDLVERGVSEISDKSFRKEGPYDLSSKSSYYMNPFLATLRAEVEARYEVPELPENTILSATPPSPEETKRSVTETYVILLENGQDVGALTDTLISRRESLHESLLDPETGKRRTKKSRDIAALERANDQLHKAQAELAETESIEPDEVSEYYSLLQKVANAEARYNFEVEQAREAQQARDEKAEPLPYGARARVEDQATAPEVRRGFKAAEKRFKKATQEADRAYALWQGLRTDLAKLKDPRTLPERTALQSKVDDAQQKLADVKRGIRSGDFREATIVQRIKDIDQALSKAIATKTRGVEYDKDGKPVNTRNQKVVEIDRRSKPISSGRANRIDTAKKDHQRAVKAALKRGKSTSGGVTQNLQFPVVVDTTVAKDGTIRRVQYIPFTNTPLVMAEALNLGYEVKVPKEFRGNSAKLNPSIRVSRDGYVAEVFHPKENRWVKSPGDLVVYSRDSAFTPSSVKDGVRAKYVSALPPVRAQDVPLLGATPLGIEGDSVATIRDRENPELSGADGEYILGALDFFDGISGGNRRRVDTDAFTKASRKINRFFRKEVGPLSRQRYLLEEALSLQPKIGTVTIPPALLPANLETGEKPTVGAEVSEEKINSLIAEAEGRVENGTADDRVRGVLESLRLVRREFLESKESFEEAQKSEKLTEDQLAELLEDVPSDSEEHSRIALRISRGVDPKTLRDAIEQRKAAVEEARAKAREAVARAKEKFGEPSEDAGRTYIRQGGSVTDLLQVVDKANGEHSDARAAAQLIYTQEIREFGVALRLLEANERGKVPSVWFKKFLKSLAPEARKDYLKYIRSRHKSKVSRKMTADEAVSFLAEAGVGEDLDTLSSALLKWDQGKKRPDRITTKQLKGFLTRLKSPELVAKLDAHLDAEAKANVNDDFFISNYVTELLDRIAPDGGTSPWVTTPGGVARPQSFNKVLRSVRKNYLDSLANTKSLEFTSIDASPEGGGESGGSSGVLAAELSAAWGLNPEAGNLNLSEDPEAEAEVASMRRAESELTTTEFYVQLARRVRNSSAAQAAVRDLAEELGAIERPDIQPIESVLMATHEMLFRDPNIVTSLDPELRTIVQRLYRSGLGSGMDFGTAEDIQETIDSNKAWYSFRIRKAGFQTEGVTHVPSLDRNDVRWLTESYISGKGVLTPAQKQVFDKVAGTLNAFNDWPTLSFFDHPNSAYARYTGAYSPDSKGLYINLSRDDAASPDTLLRGLIQHALSIVEPGGPADAAIRDVAGDIIKSYPNKKHLATKDLTPDAPHNPSVLRFAMNDPVVFNHLNRRNPSFIRKVVDAVAKAIGLTSNVGRGRLSSIVSPAPGTVWGGEPKETRAAYRPEDVTSESALSILNRVSPAGVRIHSSEDHNQPAWVSTTSPDTVFVNAKVVEEYTSHLSPEGKEQVVSALLNHELAHLASLQTLTDADRAEILAGMTRRDFEETLSRVPEGTGHLELAEEFIRMKVEQITGGVDSDVTVQSILNYGTGFRAQVVRAIQKFFAQLSRMFKARPNTRTAVHLNKVRDALASIQRGGMPLRPVPTEDVDGHWTALNELAEGTERTFFSVPLHSTDPAHESKWARWRKQRAIKREVREVENHINYNRNVYDAIIKDFHRKVRNAGKDRGVDVRGLVPTLNAAMGSTDAYFTEQQEEVLRVAKERDAANGMSPEEVLAADTERRRVAQRTHVQNKTQQQEAAMARIKQIDPELANHVKHFRDLLAKDSRAVGSIHGDGAFKAIFDDRAHIHLIRSYEFFHSKAYRDAVLAGSTGGVKGYEDVNFNDLRTLAIKSIKETHHARYGTTIDGKKAYKILDGLLSEWAQLRPDQIKLNALTKSHALFESKEALPEGVRNLLGQHSELDSAATTAVRLSNYLAKHEGAKTVRKLLLSNKWAFEDPRAGGATQLVPLWNSLQNDADYAALHGLWAPAEDKALIEETLTSVLPPTAGPEVDAVAKKTANLVRRGFGASLTLKTLFSPGFFTRNEGAMSLVMLPMQGYFSGALGLFGASNKGRRAAGLAWSGLGAREFDPGDEAYIRELLKHGIIHDDVNAGLLRDIHGSTVSLGQDIDKDLNDFAETGKPKGWIKKSIERWGKANGLKAAAIDALLTGKGGADNLTAFLSKINEAIDAKGKIQLYEYELSVLKKARDEADGAFSALTDEELKAKAAAKIHRTLPGHSQVYNSVRSLTRSNLGLLIAPFARFKGETVRIFANTIPLGLEEIREGREIGSAALKRRGLKRVASFGLVNLAFGTAFTSLISMLFDGIDDAEDREESFVPLRGEIGRAIRSSLPKWSRSHNIMARANEDGTITTYDLTYYNPLSFVQDPLLVMWDRTATDGADAGATAFLDALVNDVIGEGIGPGALRQVLTNSDDYGRDIFLETDDLGTKVTKALTHYYEGALEPGAFRLAEKLTDASSREDAVDGDRVYNVTPILVGEVVGVKPYEYKNSKLIERSAKSTKRQLDEIKTLLSPVTSPGYKTKEEIQEAVRGYQEAYEQLWKQHRRNAAAWVGLTGDEKARELYARSMVDAGHSKARTRQVLYEGVLDRFVRNRSGLETIFEAAENEGAEHGAVRVERFVDTVLEKPRFIPLTE